MRRCVAVGFRRERAEKVKLAIPTKSAQIVAISATVDRSEAFCATRNIKAVKVVTATTVAPRRLCSMRHRLLLQLPVTQRQFLGTHGSRWSRPCLPRFCKQLLSTFRLMDSASVREIASRRLIAGAGRTGGGGLKATKSKTARRPPHPEHVLRPAAGHSGPLCALGFWGRRKRSS
jgi:hypothetical protein